MSHKVLLKTLALCCLAALAGSPAFAADPLKIGVASAFTGSAAGYGDNIKAGVVMKVEEINAKGGINGRMVEPVWLDEQCDPKEAGIVASKVAKDPTIVGVVGHLCSSAHLTALPIYTREGVPVITPTATSPSISDKGADRKGKLWAFRDVYNDNFQGEFLAKYVKDVLGLKKIAVFYENNDYGIGLKEAFLKKAKEVGLEIVGEEGYMSGAQDFLPQLTKFKSANPDGLFISGYYNEGALIASQAKQLGLDVVKFGADGIDNADYIKLAGAAADNTYLTVPFLADAAGPEAKAFIAHFKERFKRDLDWMSVNAYDATGILLQAIAAVGTDRAKIADYLAAMNSPEKGYQGIAGVTYFNKQGDCEKPAFVKMVKDGKFQPATKQMQ